MRVPREQQQPAGPTIRLPRSLAVVRAVIKFIAVAPGDAWLSAPALLTRPGPSAPLAASGAAASGRRITIDLGCKEAFSISGDVNTILCATLPRGRASMCLERPLRWWPRGNKWLLSSALRQHSSSVTHTASAGTSDAFNLARRCAAVA